MDERALASICEYEMRRASLVKQKKTALALLEQCKSLGLTVGETKGALSYAESPTTTEYQQMQGGERYVYPRGS